MRPYSYRTGKDLSVPKGWWGKWCPVKQYRLLCQTTWVQILSLPLMSRVIKSGGICVFKPLFVYQKNRDEGGSAQHRRLWKFRDQECAMGNRCDWHTCGLCECMLWLLLKKAWLLKKASFGNWCHWDKGPGKTVGGLGCGAWNSHTGNSKKGSIKFAECKAYKVWVII